MLSVAHAVVEAAVVSTLICAESREREVRALENLDEREGLRGPVTVAPPGVLQIVELAGGVHPVRGVDAPLAVDVRLDGETVRVVTVVVVAVDVDVPLP